MYSEVGKPNDPKPVAGHRTCIDGVCAAMVMYVCWWMHTHIHWEMCACEYDRCVQCIHVLYNIIHIWVLANTQTNECLPCIFSQILLGSYGLKNWTDPHTENLEVCSSILSAMGIFWPHGIHGACSSPPCTASRQVTALCHPLNVDVGHV